MRFPENSISKLVISTLILVAFCQPLSAQNCTVPGTHATIQEAGDDPVCATVTLGAQVYQESIVIRRSLTITGPATGGAIVQGLVLITGLGNLVTLQDLNVENGCMPDALRAEAGARLDGDNLDVVRSATLPCPAITTGEIFADGFELGDTTSWSATVP